VQDFKKLDVWTKAHEITLSVYQATKLFPREELFGLTSQMRRCSASMGANIAEGSGRKSRPDFMRFLHIAFGSACELEYHLILARDLKYMDSTMYKDIEGKLFTVKRMLSALMKSVKRAEDSESA